MKAKSRFHGSRDGVALGDHLIAAAANVVRHGIYAGSCCVITVNCGIVAAESLEEFALGKTLEVYLQKSEFAAAEVARRAKSQVGVKVEPWDDRCFCEWCKQGLLINL
jgi:hypothetical protein